MPHFAETLNFISLQEAGSRKLIQAAELSYWGQELAETEFFFTNCAAVWNDLLQPNSVLEQRLQGRLHFWKCGFEPPSQV
jgi:hypothetical protein